MQLLQATPDVLLKPLSTVVGIVERRHTMPILANILLRKEGQRVAFIATDLDVQITTHADFGVGDDVASTTVSARKFQDILRSLPNGKDVKIGVDAGKMNVTSGKSRFSLQTLDGSEYPTVDTPDAWDVSVSIPQKVLRQLFSMVHFAMAHQDIRYYLNGMLLVFEEGLIRAVATDGHRLAHMATTVDGLNEKREVIVPRKTVSEMLRLLDDSDEPVNVDVSARQIRFTFGDVELISKLVEGKFPDYKRVIPTTYTHHFAINRELLQGCLQRAAILTTDKLKGIKLHIENNLMLISSSNTEQEEAKEELEVDYTHNSLDIGFNVSYLLDILSMAKTEEVVWSVNPDGNSSTLITIPEEEQFKYVVMPMRI